MKSYLFMWLILLICGKFSLAKNAGSNKNVTNSKNSTATSGSSVNQVITTSTTTTNRPLLSGFRLPCSCREGQCGCCTGVILDRFNQKACVNVTYEPDDFSLTAAMSLNGRVLYKRSVSGKNPPPMCLRLPRLPFIRFCVQLSNIYFASRNVHMCIDMEANWEDLTLVEWSFDCIRMGASGIAVIGPEEGGGIPSKPVDAVDQTNEDYDDSARNVAIKKTNNTPPITHCNTLIFDESVKRVDPYKIDKKLIKVKKLLNGNVLVTYNKEI